jgi:acyl dehydratase
LSLDIPFDSVVLHEPLGPVEVSVSANAVRRYCEDWDDPNEIYLESSPFGFPVVPPMFLAGLTGFQLLGSRYNARATVGARSEHRSIQPARVGSRLITAGSIVEKYLRRGLEYVVVESRTRDQDGRDIRWSRDHILLGVERRPGSAQARAPRAAPPAPPVAPERAGPEIPATRKKAYQKALAERRFSHNSIHNDEYTRRQGYAGALMSAYVLCGYMSELLVNFFGPDWLRGGWLSLAFINGGVQQGDPICCRGVVTGTSEEADGRRHELDIWMEKGSGRRVVAGRASGTDRTPRSGEPRERESAR